ncbi:hypothetical protein MACH09_27960 [Vibrio sp. MACH09]|uniref:YecH family metal-binding protein n=1 Tax=unclassified Vibrio TaxID=2614977 RepID=UPI0014933E65|nr:MULTISPECIES: YecH family metal-binding protein [unclassified Vibrio]NOI68450.1 DUF2492 family protein [Vibrio sp. 99-8-1]GLO62288.1 hypothetical protein MACH09_27960 [Vibrio sp. MACH09]
MAQQIHGHTVLDILSENSLTREELKSYLTEKYGKDVLFHTCQSEGLDFDTLFDFFISKQKVSCVAGKFSSCAANKCAH